MWIHNLTLFHILQAIASLPSLLKKKKKRFPELWERGETTQIQLIKLGEGEALEESPSGFWEYKVYDEIQAISRIILT